MDNSKKRILIAEDDPALQRLFRKTLLEYGYDVVSVSSGEEAHDKLTSSHFDVVVTDIYMGGVMSGVGIAGRGFLEYPKTKIVVITGMVGLANSAVGRSGFPGSHATLFKPVLPDQLVETIEDVLSA